MTYLKKSHDAIVPSAYFPFFKIKSYATQKEKGCNFHHVSTVAPPTSTSRKRTQGRLTAVFYSLTQKQKQKKTKKSRHRHHRNCFVLFCFFLGAAVLLTNYTPFLFSSFPKQQPSSNSCLSKKYEIKFLRICATHSNIQRRPCKILPHVSFDFCFLFFFLSDCCLYANSSLVRLLPHSRQRQKNNNNTKI